MLKAYWGMPSKGLGMLSIAEVANFRGDVGACSPPGNFEIKTLGIASQCLDLKYNQTYDYFYHV